MGRRRERKKEGGRGIMREGERDIERFERKWLFWIGLFAYYASCKRQRK